MNQIPMPDSASSSRQSPVAWDRLKQIQDQHAVPRVSGAVVVGIVLLGLSIFSFLLGFYLALDPTEWIEPAQYFFMAAVALGLLSGWAGVVVVLRAARGPGA
jgi:hypothetical protein